MTQYQSNKIRRLRVRVEELEQALRDCGDELQGEWHSFGCNLRSNGIGIKWCTCGAQRAVLEGVKEVLAP